MGGSLHLVEHLNHVLVLLTLVVKLHKISVSQAQRLLGVFEIHTQFLDSALRICNTVNDSAVCSNRGVETLV